MIVASAPSPTSTTLRVATTAALAEARNATSSTGLSSLALAGDVDHRAVGHEGGVERQHGVVIAVADVQKSGRVLVVVEHGGQRSDRHRAVGDRAPTASGAYCPSTNTTRCASRPASGPSAASTSASVDTRSLAPAPAAAPPSSALRRSVYFHSSMRRCGRPSAANGADRRPCAPPRHRQRPRRAASAATASKLSASGLLGLGLRTTATVIVALRQLPQFTGGSSRAAQAALP